MLQLFPGSVEVLESRLQPETRTHPGMQLHHLLHVGFVVDVVGFARL